MEYNLKNRPKEHESKDDDLTYYELLCKETMLWFEGFEAELREIKDAPNTHWNLIKLIEEILGES